MSEWKECQLGDLITFQRGHDLPKTKMQGGKYPVVGSNGIIGYHNEYTTEAPSITIGRSGNVGKPFLFKGRSWSHNTSLYIKEYKAVDPIFIYYFLHTLDLGNYAGGSAVPTLNRNHIHTLNVYVPTNIEEQRRIGAVLSVIDDKIELNTAINENLEQQAQALFKAWFVDFEPFGGVMPDDWRMGTLSEICGYSKDKVDIDDLTLDTYYSTENMQPNRQGAVQATTLPTIKQTTACKKGDVLISNIRPYFKKILYCFSDCGCSTDVLCFVPNKTDYSAFLYCALYADKFFDYMVAGSKGTKMPRGDKQQIMVYPICIPSAEYIEKFNKAVAPMLETVYTNRIEANNLANLRDTLLPKLMNGEIDVSAVQI